MMLQVFLNIEVFGMDPQSAVEAERIASHKLSPTRTTRTITCPEACGSRGASVPPPAKLSPRSDTGSSGIRNGAPANTSPDISSVCVIRKDLASGVMTGGADPRRPAYGLGW